MTVVLNMDLKAVYTIRKSWGEPMIVDINADHLDYAVIDKGNREVSCY